MTHPADSSYYRIRLRVHWADTDAAGVVYYGTYFRYFEAAEDALFRALGSSRMDIIAEYDMVMPRVEATCRFRSPARAEEELTVGIAIGPRTHRRITYFFEIRQRASDRLVAEGSYRIACVNRHAFTAMDVPPAIQALLDRVPELVREQRESGLPLGD